MSKKFIQREVETASKNLSDIAQAMEHEVEKEIALRREEMNHPGKPAAGMATPPTDHWFKRLSFIKEELDHAIEGLKRGLW